MRHPARRVAPPAHSRGAPSPPDPLEGMPWTSSIAPPQADPSGKPLAERMRPRRLEDFAGQEHVLGPGTGLRRAIEADQVPSLIVWGPPGTGKTTLARIVAQRTGAEYVPFSAVLGGVKEIREIVAGRPRPAQDEPQADHPLRRRDPPVHQGPAGRVPPARRGRDHHPHRRHHREPVVRGDRRPPLPVPGGDPARAHRGGGGRAAGPGGGRARGAGRDGGALARGARGHGPLRLRRRPPGAQRAGGGRRGGAPGRTGSHRARRRRGGAADQDASSTTRRARSTTTSSPPSSSRCAARTPTRPSTTWSGCWRAARTRASCSAGW